MKYLSGCTSPETAFVVDDYPYGFRLRTKIRYWIETTKNGDRFCSQTLNPKVAGEKWNAPKKSTYMAVMAMTQADDTGYISSRGISLGWSGEDAIQKFLAEVGPDFPWSVEQKKKIALALGIARTQKYVTCTIVNTTAMSEEELAARDAEQKKVKESMAKACYCETKGAEKEMGL